MLVQHLLSPSLPRHMHGIWRADWAESSRN